MGVDFPDHVAHSKDVFYLRKCNWGGEWVQGGQWHRGWPWCQGLRIHELGRNN
jgi:hypothetical protein